MHCLLDFEPNEYDKLKKKYEIYDTKLAKAVDDAFSYNENEDTLKNSSTQRS